MDKELQRILVPKITFIRIEHVGNLYFVDYRLPNGDWKNYSSHATHTEALSEKAYLLSVFQEMIRIFC